jgi:uncharacterized membrane protein
MEFARWLHVLGVIVWVGGMFFAHMVLRPSVQSLPPPVRLPLLAATISRFFGWVAVAVVAILVSGFGMIAMRGGFAGVGPGVHTMVALGLVMTLVYAYLAAVPLRTLRAGVAAADWPRAGAAMGRIRLLVLVNLVLGLVTLTVAMLVRQ